MGEIKLILIEDNVAITETLSLALSQNYQFISASNGYMGVTMADQLSPDIILLELDLPDMSGINVCRQIREIGVTAPILVLSGDRRLATKLKVFAAGADDYIVKPFSLGELKARLNVIRNRIEGPKIDGTVLRTKSLLLDLSLKTVRREGGESIGLRRKEFAILEYLVKNAGETVSRNTIASHAWPNKTLPWSNVVDVHIKNLRDKIDKPYGRQLITTVHGRGYRLDES